MEQYAYFLKKIGTFYEGTKMVLAKYRHSRKNDMSTWQQLLNCVHRKNGQDGLQNYTRNQ